MVFSLSLRTEEPGDPSSCNRPRPIYSWTLNRWCIVHWSCLVLFVFQVGEVETPTSGPTVDADETTSSPHQPINDQLAMVPLPVPTGDTPLTTDFQVTNSSWTWLHIQLFLPIVQRIWDSYAFSILLTSSFNPWLFYYFILFLLKFWDLWYWSCLC